MNESAECSDIYSGEIVMGETDLMIYELSGGDIYKAGAIRKLPLKTVYGFLYLNRLKQLNRILAASKK